MASLRDIKRRIRSVTSTRQITHTMEMVSTTKIMKALQTAAEAEPYKEAMKTMLSNLAAQGASYGQQIMASRGDTSVALVIVVASDRGLAGGFNVQVQRAAQKQIAELVGQGLGTEVITCGTKPTEFFGFQGPEPVMSFTGISAEPTYDEANRIAHYAIEGYVRGSLGQVDIWYQHAKSRVEQELVHEEILPLYRETLIMPNRPREEEAVSPIELTHHSTFEFDPSPREVLRAIVPAYVRTVIHHALIDSAAAEHGARRRAMQAATENADEIIETLSREYNRIRQSSITTELNEIVGGANALEESS